MFCVDFYVKYFHREAVVKKKEKKKERKLWLNDMYAEWLGDRLKFVFSPDIILCMVD